MADQDIREARERVKALRDQVRAEQNDRAVASAELAKESRLSALSEEERHLEAQLEEIRSVQRPGEAPEGVVPAEPGEGNVNVKGEPLRPGDPLPEGGFTETVDAFGNLVRMPLEAETGETAPPQEPAVDPNTGQPVLPAEPAPVRRRSKES